LIFSSVYYLKLKFFAIILNGQLSGELTYPLNFTGGTTYTISINLNTGDCAGSTPLHIYVEDPLVGIASESTYNNGVFTFVCTATGSGTGYIEFYSESMCSSFYVGDISMSYYDPATANGVSSGYNMGLTAKRKTMRLKVQAIAWILGQECTIHV
jgi:hypothetical protein